MIDLIETIYFAGVAIMSLFWLAFVYPQLRDDAGPKHVAGALVTIVLWPIFAPLGFIFHRSEK